MRNLGKILPVYPGPGSHFSSCYLLATAAASVMDIYGDCGVPRKWPFVLKELWCVTFPGRGCARSVPQRELADSFFCLSYSCQGSKAAWAQVLAV